MTWNEQPELEEAEMLQLYWSSLVASGEDPPPAGLDPQIAAQLERALCRSLSQRAPSSPGCKSNSRDRLPHG